MRYGHVRDLMEAVVSKISNNVRSTQPSSSANRPVHRETLSRDLVRTVSGMVVGTAARMSVPVV